MLPSKYLTKRDCRDISLFTHLKKGGKDQLYLPSWGSSDDQMKELSEAKI